MNSIYLCLPGSIRSKKNSKIISTRGKFPRAFPSKAYKKWEDNARAEVLIYKSHFGYRPDLVTKLNVHIKAVFYYSGPEPDLSGCLESIGDCLQSLLYENDKQIYSWDGSRKIRVPVGQERTEVWITEFKE